MPSTGQLSRRRLLVGTGATLAAMATRRAIGGMAVTQYQPDQVTVATDATYRLSDGSIRVVGDIAMEPLLIHLNEAFIQRHPAIRFTMVLRDSPTGIDGIIAGISAFAPMARDAWETELDPFKRLTGYRPFDIRIGRRGYVGPGHQNPPGIYVNAANPLRQLTISEVGRILTAGQMPSDLRHWRQLGVQGEWAKHAIHVYGTRDDGKFVTGLRSARFGGRPFARQYEALSQDADVLEAVAGDRYGIGLAGFVDAAMVPKHVRFLALAQDAGTAASTADYEEVRNGRYPLAPYLHLYVPSASGQSVDSVVKHYIRLALSPDGQRIIEELKGLKEAYVPLSPDEARRELAMIE
jgi:phosphate transport system substrate-binding protein